MILTSDEAREKARRRLPKILFDYLDGGGSGERTMARNVEDFRHILFRQRVLADSGDRSLATRFMGHAWPAPMVLGPVGFAGAFRRDGEILAARAAHGLGLPYCLSMFSICSLTALREATDGDIWCQLYATKDRDLFDTMLARAEACAVDTLCITVDTPAGGFRPRDIRSGMRGATRLGPRMLASLAARPRWCLGMAPAGMPRFGNLDGVPQAGGNAFVQASYLGQQIDGSFGWDGLGRLRDRWKGRLILKGVLAPEDAQEAVSRGVDGIVVSNHGGRQVDDFPSTISSLAAIAAAVAGKADVMLDGGVRSGVDVAKAVALGAKAVWIGRPYAYALAAEGQPGVRSLLSSFIAEMESALAHIGMPGLDTLDARTVIVRSDRFALPAGGTPESAA